MTSRPQIFKMMAYTNQNGVVETEEFGDLTAGQLIDTFQGVTFVKGDTFEITCIDDGTSTISDKVAYDEIRQGDFVKVHGMWMEVMVVKVDMAMIGFLLNESADQWLMATSDTMIERML